MEKRFPIIDKTKTGRRLRCLMSGMTIDDIVKKMLQSYGIPDESLDMALEKIKQTKF